MKSNVKARQQFKRDAQAAETMLLYMLGELNKHFGFGKMRLQKLHDLVLLEMFKDVARADARISLGAWDSYQRFAMDNELTHDKFMERQKDEIDKFLAELTKQVMAKKVIR